MKTKRIDLDHKPLRYIVSLFSTGVPTKQIYNPSEGSYTPDYSEAGVPLTIRLEVRIQDPSSFINTSLVNKDLYDIAYYLNIEGTRTLLVSGGGKANIMLNNDDSKGTIQIVSNLIPVGKTASLELEAKYTDPRTLQVQSIRGSISLSCIGETMHESVLLDTASQRYDPFQYESATNQQPKIIKIKATHRFGAKASDYDANKLKFIWKKLRDDNGAFSDVGSSDLDYDCSVSGNCGETITIDRSLMGENITLRCYALYSSDGNVSAKSIVATTPMQTVSFARVLPDYDYEAIDLIADISQSVYALKPHMKVMTNKGTVSNANEILEMRWYVGSNTNSGNTLPSIEVGHGENAEIPCSYITDSNGMLVGYNVYDAGGLKALVDSDGAILVDSDGSILVG